MLNRGRGIGPFEDNAQWSGIIFIGKLERQHFANQRHERDRVFVRLFGEPIPSANIR